MYCNIYSKYRKSKKTKAPNIFLKNIKSVLMNTKKYLKKKN